MKNNAPRKNGAQYLEEETRFAKIHTDKEKCRSPNISMEKIASEPSPKIPKTLYVAQFDDLDGTHFEKQDTVKIYNGSGILK